MQKKMFFKDSEGNKLCGVISDPTENFDKPIIILSHGFGSDKNRKTYVMLESILNKKEISTFRFDFFARGESEGNSLDFTISRGVDGILNAIKFLKEIGYNKIGLFGSSFGGICSIVAATKNDGLMLLALKSPASNYHYKLIKDMGEEKIEEWEKRGVINIEGSTDRLRYLKYDFFEDAKENIAYDLAHEIKIPTLIVHGDLDESVPFEQSQKTANLIKGCKLVIIKGADHKYSSNDDFVRMLAVISEFIFEEVKKIKD